MDCVIIIIFTNIKYNLYNYSDSCPSVYTIVKLYRLYRVSRKEHALKHMKTESRAHVQTRILRAQGTLARLQIISPLNSRYMCARLYMHNTFTRLDRRLHIIITSRSADRMRRPSRQKRPYAHVSAYLPSSTLCQYEETFRHSCSQALVL